MSRYFIEVSYKGTSFSGFQVQQNANTIQSEVEKALQVFFKKSFSLTGASRTDSGVHALQNYFHFDLPDFLQKVESRNLDTVSGPSDFPGFEASVYHLNAILPPDIVIKKIFQVDGGAHCRFDAVSRAYKYYIYRRKDPFLKDRAFYFPYRLDIDLMNEAAKILLRHADFTSFSKRNTQVNNFFCTVNKSEWITEGNTLVYHVEANRFLRGMVKGFVGTMLRVGTHKLSLDQFRNIINLKDCSGADFSVPPHGLFLVAVIYKF